MLSEELAYRDVDHLDPKSVADKVVGEDYGALQAGILPSVVVWICNVQLCDSDSVDLVGSLGDLSLDILLVIVGQDGRHGEDERVSMRQSTVTGTRRGNMVKLKLLPRHGRVGERESGTSVTEDQARDSQSDQPLWTRRPPSPAASALQFCPAAAGYRLPCCPIGNCQSVIKFISCPNKHTLPSIFVSLCLVKALHSC
jgi:hypothetical protein